MSLETEETLREARMEQVPGFAAEPDPQEEAGTKREALWDLANRICDRHGLKGKNDRPEPQG